MPWDSFSPKELSAITIKDARYHSIDEIIERLILDITALSWVDRTLEPNHRRPTDTSALFLFSNDGSFNRSRNAFLIKTMAYHFKDLSSKYANHKAPNYAGAMHNMAVIEDDLKDLTNIMLSLRGR